MKKKFLCSLLALVMLLSLVACGNNNDSNPAGTENPTGTENPSTTPAEPGAFQPLTYDDETLYMNALGEFYDAYLVAQESDDLDELYALMAIAEAKLTESAVLPPYYGRGGNYAISRAVPRTAPTVMWGSDLDRYENMLIATEFITPEVRSHIVSLWGELAGTGEFEQAARDYLAEQGYTLKDTYTFTYSSDPEIWDTLSAWESTTSEPICNTVDGLVMYDMENVLQPALAESWEVSDDGLTWTFHIRQGVAWTDSQGRQVDTVKADDWVASLQHLLDCAQYDSAAEIFCDVIEGATEYVNKEYTDFSQVGVEAVDEYTLVYTLTAPCPYFDTMLTYCGVGAPLSRSYYTSLGGQFGADFDNTADSYAYAMGPDSIAYCGPYLITSWTASNSFIFDANPSYWNADNINIRRITWTYNDGSDATKAYEDAVAGVIDGAGLNASAAQKCREDGLFDLCYIAGTTATSYMGNYNLNRKSYAVFNNPTLGISPISHESVDDLLANELDTSDIEDEAARTHVAINNQNFRLALSFGLDRGSYHAQSVSEDLKLVALRNSYVPGTFASLSKDVTVSINGTSTTFPAGTWYGEIMQAQIDADGYPIKVWDPDGDDGLGSGDGFDGWYNVDNAREYMAKAVEELAAQGVEVSAENPIQIDYYYYSGMETYTNQAHAYEQSITNSLEGLVQVNLVAIESYSDYLYTGYFTGSGADACFDVAFISGWSADYGDPGSYLSTMLPYGSGYVTKNLGLW